MTIGAGMDGKSGDQRAAWYCFGLIAVLTMVVMLKVELPLLLGRDLAWDRKIDGYRWLLHIHAMFGSLALFCAPGQFFPDFRQRHMRLHRGLGRVYVGAIAIASPLGIYISISHLSGNERLAAAVQGLAWLAATAMAVYAVMDNRLRAHQAWMTRSYALTLTFVISRFVTDVLGVAISPAIGGQGALVWMCTVCALLAGTRWPPGTASNWRIAADRARQA